MTIKRRESPSQTAGPYVHIGCAPSAAGLEGYPNDLGQNIISADCEGPRIILTGAIFDGGGAAVTDALIELWQADADGLYPPHSEDPGFHGFGRRSCDASGAFSFETIKPSAIDQAPHVTLWIVARGINLGLHTRVYFDGDDHSSDPVMERVAPDRRQTLVAQQITPGAFHIDIHLQGPKETVFFDI